MKTLTILVIFLFIFSSNCFAQLTLQWQKHYSLNNSAAGNSLAIDNRGNIYVAGNSSHDLLLLKYNESGDLIWQKSYNPGGNYCIATKILYKNNFLYSVGYTSANSLRSLTTIKYDTLGNMVWIKPYQSVSSSSYDDAFIALDSNQNVLVTGGITTGSTGLDIITIKYDNNGNQLWFSIVDGPSHIFDHPRGIFVDPSGSVYVASSATIFYYQGVIRQEFLTIKYNSIGQIQWSKHYGDGVDLFSSCLDNSMNIIVVGGVNLGYGTVKYDLNGNLMWERTFNYSSNYDDHPLSVTVDNNCNIYLTGILSIHTPPTQMGTVKYNAAGMQIWNKIYSSTNSVSGKIIKFRENDGVYIIGSSGNHVLLYKYTPEGITIFSNVYSYSSESPKDFALDDNDNMYITGSNTHIGQGYTDLFLVKYSQAIGINPISSKIPTNFSLSQNYPNPFNPTTKIRFALPPSLKREGLGVRVIVFDILGREVTTLVNEQLKPGTYEVTWDAADYSSGVYFYKLSAGDFNESKKMVLVK